MTNNGLKVMDSDMHIMEPPDLWERYIDREFRDRAPRGVTSDNVRDLRMVYPDGSEWARKTTRENNSSRGQNFERNQEIYRCYAERAGLRKFNLKLWISKVSMLPSFIQPEA